MYSLEATHHYVYMYSFQPIFYYLIDWHILSISFIDPFQQVFILAIFKKPCRRCKFGDHITNFYFYSLRWNLVTLCLIYVFFLFLWCFIDLFKIKCLPLRILTTRYSAYSQFLKGILLNGSKFHIIQFSSIFGLV